MQNRLTIANECPENIKQALRTGLKCEDLPTDQKEICCASHQNSINLINRRETLERFIFENKISQFDQELKKQEPPLEPEEIGKIFEAATMDYDNRSISDDRNFISSLLAYYDQKYPGCLENYVINRDYRNLVITPPGVRGVLEHFMNSNPSFPFAPISITEDLDKTLYKIKSKNKAEINQAIIFNRKIARPSFYQSLHTSMLLIRKTQEKCTIINVDSINKGSDFLQFVINSVQKYMPKCKIYSFKETRQSDITNCPVFTVLDYIEHSKSSLFDYVDFIERKNQINNQCQIPEANGTETLTKVITKQLDFFPPSFMSLTQSLEKITQYIRESSQEFDQDSIDLLTEKVNSHIKFIPREDKTDGKAANLLVHHRLKSYLDILLKKCIKLRVTSK